MSKIYSVRVTAPVLGREGKGTRRRGGQVFSSTPLLVSTSKADGVELVDEKQLEAILADPYLESTETTVSKAQAAAKAAAEAMTPAPAPATEPAPAAATATRAATAKGAKKGGKGA